MRRAIGAGLLILLTSGCGISTYVVKGTVLRPAEAGEPEGARPVVGAKVVVTDNPGTVPRLHGMQTDAEGRFKLTFLSAPPWGDFCLVLRAEAPGYGGRSVALCKPVEKGDWSFCAEKEGNICWEAAVVLERER